MVMASAEFSEAVLFVDQTRISREMLYSEFEAVLDGVVPIPDLANKIAEAVYLRITGQLCIKAAVFFRIAFDGEGHADRRWNVPLEQFADNSAKGPDLGAGPIRLACHSQCSIAWHQQNLWDPEMTPGANSFVLLKKAIKANRLGLEYHEALPPPQPPPSAQTEAQTVDSARARAMETREIENRVSQKLRRQLEQEFRNHMARLLKEQRLRILTLNSQRKQEIQQLQLSHQKRLHGSRQALDKQQQELELLRQRNQELKETIEGQAGKIQGLREYFEHKLRAVQLDEGAQLQDLRENYTAELEAKVEAATLEVQEKLQLREIELMYRSEQESSLEEEIRRLREENQVLLSNSSEQLLEKLESAGLNFVAYHPGAGHMTVPLMDMSRYLDDPVAYAAKKCGVNTPQYKEWLTHYKQPVCQAIETGGGICGSAIERVASPGQFHAGENDRCNRHKTAPARTFGTPAKNAAV